jgi:hypothetical protein
MGQARGGRKLQKIVDYDNEHRPAVAELSTSTGLEEWLINRCVLTMSAQNEKMVKDY